MRKGIPFPSFNYFVGAEGISHIKVPSREDWCGRCQSHVPVSGQLILPEQHSRIGNLLKKHSINQNPCDGQNLGSCRGTYPWIFNFEHGGVRSFAFTNFPKKRFGPMDNQWIFLGYHASKRWPIDIFAVRPATPTTSDKRWQTATTSAAWPSDHLN